MASTLKVLVGDPCNKKFKTSTGMDMVVEHDSFCTFTLKICIPVKGQGWRNSAGNWERI